MDADKIRDIKRLMVAQPKGSVGEDSGGSAPKVQIRRILGIPHPELTRVTFIWFITIDTVKLYQEMTKLIA